VPFKILYLFLETFEPFLENDDLENDDPENDDLENDDLKKNPFGRGRGLNRSVRNTPSLDKTKIAYSQQISV